MLQRRRLLLLALKLGTQREPAALRSSRPSSSPLSPARCVAGGSDSGGFPSCSGSSQLQLWRAFWVPTTASGEMRRKFVMRVGAEGVQQQQAGRGGGLWRQQVRYVKVNGSEVKQGNVIERKGRLYQVLKTQHTQQGRGGATIQVELRDVQNGLKSSERLRTSESIERVFVDEKPYTFLYSEGSSVVLMEPKSFEQLELSKDLLGPGAAYLSDGMEVIVQQYDGQPFSATVPAKVTCTVSEAEPYFKGQSATPTYKRIVLENGQQISAPSFITAGDQVVIDTTDNSYVTRAK